MSNQNANANVPAMQGKATEKFSGMTVEKSAELAAVAVAESARAEVESSYVMALKSPRNEEDARVRILKACTSPLFAKKARFRKPVGSKQVNGRYEQQFVIGPSIRFAEEMLRSWRNVLTQATTIYDDPMKRVVKITVRDLEANITYSKEITIEKTVERRSNKDRVVITQRVNSYNEIVYIVQATEDEIAIKEAALTSKVIRNNGLRLIPQHIVDEAMDNVEQMIRNNITTDPEKERRELLDSFSRRGVMPADLESYIGAPVAQFTPEHLIKLRDILTALEENSVTWAEFLEGTSAEITKEISEKSQPETKGAAILDKIGKAAPKAAEPEKKAEAKPAEPAPVQQPVPQPAASQPSGAGKADEVSDSTWVDIIEYLDGDSARAALKKQVRERLECGNLTKLPAAKRKSFLLTLQDEAKKQGIELQQLVKE